MKVVQLIMKTDWSDVREESVNDKYISGEDFNLQKKKRGEKSKNESIFYKWRARAGESEQGSAYQ